MPSPELMMMCCLPSVKRTAMSSSSSSMTTALRPVVRMLSYSDSAVRLM